MKHPDLKELVRQLDEATNVVDLACVAHQINDWTAETCAEYASDLSSAYCISGDPGLTYIPADADCYVGNIKKIFEAVQPKGKHWVYRIDHAGLDFSDPIGHLVRFKEDVPSAHIIRLGTVKDISASLR